MNHAHFSEDDENLQNGIIQTFDLLTNKIKLTNYIKGNTIYKAIVEIEYPNGEINNIGESGLLIFPFWKKKIIETKVLEPIIDKKEIEVELDEIIN
ncbi:MAG: hypothetical protein Q4G16_07280 [Cruoricaptor ignavus]|nr:hypothetical protein [Cruoricaptor ignavus]